TPFCHGGRMMWQNALPAETARRRPGGKAQADRACLRNFTETLSHRWAPRRNPAGPGRDHFPMRNLKLTISYDGTDYNGWQTQPGYRTVQETLEKAIADLTGEAASASTLAGVHAECHSRLLAVRHTHTRRITRAAFCPPKPTLVETAVR